MSAMREKDQADFDLEAFIDLFDEAITSDDPNVQKTLQHLMVIVALARNHKQHNRTNGPMRRMFEDLRDINNRLGHLETNLRGYQKGFGPVPTPYPGVFSPTGPTWTTTGTQWPPAPGTYPPGTLFAQGVGGPVGSGSTALAGTKSSTSYTWDPVAANSIVKKINTGTSAGIVERADDLLKDEKYKGSSVGASDVKTA